MSTEEETKKSAEEQAAEGSGNETQDPKSAETPAEIPEELQQEIIDATDKGDFAKADELLKSLPDDMEDKQELIDDNQKLWDAKKELESKEPPAEEEQESEEIIKQKEAFHKALEKGHHVKAEEILSEFPEATQGLDLMENRLLGYQMGKDAKPIGKKKDEEVKEPTDEAIIEAYEALEHLLAEKEVIERGKKMPFKFYFVHFRQITQLKRQFEKTRRI